jgi:photosystem II stability/assembly factor-like uncharacterized protein
MNKKLLVVLFIIVLVPVLVVAKGKETKKDSTTIKMYKGLKWRSVGPAFTSGRVSDIVVNPKDNMEYYVAGASGNIWKTENWGITFKPVFENYGAYSIGCLAINPDNPNIVWAGTGENNHQRALGYGDGIYKTVDGGKTWKNMGLKNSRQIGQIAIDPRNTNIVFVAAEGSVWGNSKDRGLYKTIDGGKSWKKVLFISKYTGVNNVIFDPRNPDIMYATSEQRRRHVFTKIGGGPESAVYKSEDAGETWHKIMKGLPKVDLGGMGIAISPANPEYIYLCVEAADGKSGFFRSTNRGASWERRSNQYSSGQYFNEIFCDPVNPEKVFLMDVRSKVTLDGGKSWKNVGNNNKHVDDHAMWIDEKTNSHFLIAGDGGIYETYDNGKSFDFKENLPITQFYRVFVDDSKPFYFIYGGTQDNQSMGGPSQTLSNDGIVNSDWFVTNGGDGFWSAVDPEEPNIVYAESQYAGMVRYDRQSKEAIDIRPEPRKGELTYRWNWDTPLFISPHNHKRIYCAANKVFRSENRGNSWEVISDDLTAQIDRNSFPVMDKFWSIDAVAKDKSTSLYGTIVSMCESPIQENLLYVGTDDGLIQITENAKDWRKISSFPGVPKYTYVSDILPSKFDENIVFVSFNNTKRDDFKPYLLKSTDKGKTWKLISGNLPKNGSIHTIEQDFVNPDLLFVGTEFGFFYSYNGGKEWIQLKSGLPTISVKDIALQKRENDIVIATFGRGFYVLDDYSALRKIDKNTKNKKAIIFPVRDAKLFIKTGGRYGQGSNYYKAKNPDFGAIFTYYLKEVPKTLKEIRKEKEKKLFEKGKPIPQPTNEEMLEEKEEVKPYLVFKIQNTQNKTVRKFTKEAKKGIQRVAWNLRHNNLSPVNVKDKFNPTKNNNSSTLVTPGKYKVTMSLVTREKEKELAGPVEFKVVPLNNKTLKNEKSDELFAFQEKVNELTRTINGTEKYLNDLLNRMEKIKQALINTPEADNSLMNKADKMKDELKNISLKFRRDNKYPSVEENPPSPVTLNERLNILKYTHRRSTSGITQKEKLAYEILLEVFPPLQEKIKEIENKEIKNLELELEELDAPWTPGRLPKLKLK